MSKWVNEGPTVVVVDESFKLFFFNGGGQSVDNNKQVGDKLIELQLKRHVKDRQTRTLLLASMARNGDILRGSSNHLENNGRTKFYLNIIRNM